MRKLWEGDTVDHRGDFYEVENARLFDPPARPVPVIVSGFGTQAAELAGRIGDGYWGTSPDRELVEAFEKAGGSGPRYAQLNVCWAATRPTAGRPCTRSGPTPGSRGQLSQDLPTWTHFEQASEPLTEEQVDEVGAVRARLLDDVLDSVGEVPRRRLRPPVLPPDRARPGRLLPVLAGRARAGARRSLHRTPQPAHERTGAGPALHPVRGGTAHAHTRRATRPWGVPERLAPHGVELLRLQCRQRSRRARRRGAASARPSRASAR